MKRILKNTNPITNPITNILAYMLLAICVALKTLPMFLEVKQEVDNVFIYTTGFIGLVLVFVPDEFTSILKRTLKRKSNEI